MEAPFGDDLEELATSDVDAVRAGLCVLVLAESIGEDRLVMSFGANELADWTPS